MDMVRRALSADDANIIATLRALLAPHRGELKGLAFREPFATIMEGVEGAADVIYEEGRIGGISGVWCLPQKSRVDARILYVHGGAYIAGSAKSHRYLAGQIAHRTSIETFIPDYRLAPEYPFPTAIKDVTAAWLGLTALPGHLALVGDSAGGGLALSLVQELERISARRPDVVAVMSPWTDLALTGPSVRDQADSDFLLTDEVLRVAAELYLHGHDAGDYRASPLYGDLSRLPPTRIDVGGDEILLDDSVRYANKAQERGSDVTLAVWSGMPHVFPSNIGRLEAATAALDEIAAFIGRHCGGNSTSTARDVAQLRENASAVLGN